MSSTAMSRPLTRSDTRMIDGIAARLGLANPQSPEGAVLASYSHRYLVSLLSRGFVNEFELFTRLRTRLSMLESEPREHLTPGDASALCRWADDGGALRSFADTLRKEP